MFTICKVTIKEFLRNKLLYILLVVAVFLIFLSMFLSGLALSESQKIVIDFSLWVVELFGLVFTLFFGSHLIYKDLSSNTISIILSKNYSKTKFIIWKFFGFAILLLLIYVILTLSFVFVSIVNNIDFQAVYLLTILFSYIKILVVLAFVIFFSTFVSPFLALIFSGLIYVLWHMMSFVKFYITNLQKPIFGLRWQKIVVLFYYILPNFDFLSIKEYLLSPYISNITLLQSVLAVVTNLLYVSLLLIFSVLIFKKREF